jgi:GAF domain-containing protein
VNSPAQDSDRALGHLIDDLRERLSVSRATLRLDVPGDEPLPMTHESLADGVESVHGRVVAAAGAPTVTRMERDRSVVVVNDCEHHGEVDPLFDSPGFRAMIRDYGGLGAFVAAPLVDGGRIVGILSVHHLGSPRVWTSDELSAVADAIEQVRALWPPLASVRRSG